MARHSVYNFAGSVAPLAVLLVVTPLYISAIGAERYGIIAIFLTLLNSLTFMSLGLGPAVTQRIAKLAKAKAEERSQVVWTALLLAGSLAIAGAAVTLVAAKFYFARFAETPSSLQTEVAAALPLLALAFPLVLIPSVLTGAIHGRQQFGWLNVIRVATACAVSIVPLLIAWSGRGNLPALFVGITCTYLASFLLQLVVTWRVVPLQRPRRPRLETAQRLTGFGVWMSVSFLVGMLLTQWDRFAIGATLGFEAVAAYQVPFLLVSQLLLAPAAIMSAAFPKLAAADEDGAQTLGDRSFKILSLVVTPTAIIGLLAIGPFLAVWIGKQLPASTLGVAYLLIVGMWANALAQAPAAALVARGRVRLIATIHVAEAVPYVILLYVGLHFAGIWGAAAAWSARSLADAAILFKVSGIGRHRLKLLVPGLLIGAVASINLALPITSVLRWLLSGTIAVLVIWLSWHNRPRGLSITSLFKQFGREDAPARSVT